MAKERSKDLLKLLMLRSIDFLEMDTEKSGPSYEDERYWTSEFEDNKATLKQTLHMIRKVSIELEKTL